MRNRYGVEGPVDYLAKAHDIESAQQGAVLAMTRELAAVHAREGIRVNNLLP